VAELDDPDDMRPAFDPALCECGHYGGQHDNDFVCTKCSCSEFHSQAEDA